MIAVCKCNNHKIIPPFRSNRVVLMVCDSCSGRRVSKPTPPSNSRLVHRTLDDVLDQPILLSKPPDKGADHG